MPKMHQNTFGDKAPPGPAEGAKRFPRLLSRNKRGLNSKGKDISIDWPQDSTTSLKYKAQLVRIVPNSLHILLMENKHRTFFVIWALKKVQIYA